MICCICNKECKQATFINTDGSLICVFCKLNKATNLAKEKEKYIQKLKPYLRHNDLCDSMEDISPCSCGLDEVNK